MKEREGANHHPHQPERAESQEQSRYRVDHYGKSRNFAAYEGSTLIAVTLYRKGAAEITARLADKDRTIAALESQLATMSESQVFPAPPSAEPVPAPTWTPPRQLAFIAALAPAGAKVLLSFLIRSVQFPTVIDLRTSSATSRWPSSL